jgi:hypothetical protein
MGHRILLDDDMLEVLDKQTARMIMKVPRTLNRMYKIELNTIQPKCLMAKIDDQAWLRLGHVNFRSMKQLVSKEIATGVPKIRHLEQVCSDCLTAKLSRVAFPKAAGGNRMRSSVWCMWICVGQ